MTITVSQIITPTVGTGTAANSTTVTLSAGAAVGQVVLHCGASSAAASAMDYTVTDSGTNTYTQRGNPFISSNGQAFMASSKLTTLLSSGTSTINDVSKISGTPTSVSKRERITLLLDGADEDFDSITNATGHNDASANPPTVTSSATSVDNCMAVAVFVSNNANGTWSQTGWTVVQTASATGTADKRLIVAYKDCGSSGSTITFAPTLSTPSASGSYDGDLYIVKPTPTASTVWLPSVDVTTSGLTHNGASTFSADLADNDDTTYVEMDNGELLVIRLGPQGIASDHTGWKIKVEGYKLNTAATATVTLKQNGTTIKSGTATLTGSNAETVISLSTGQADTFIAGADSSDVTIEISMAAS